MRCCLALLRLSRGLFCLSSPANSEPQLAQSLFTGVQLVGNTASNRMIIVEKSIEVLWKTRITCSGIVISALWSMLGFQVLDHAAPIHTVGIVCLTGIIFSLCLNKQDHILSFPIEYQWWDWFPWKTSGALSEELREIQGTLEELTPVGNVSVRFNQIHTIS